MKTNFIYLSVILPFIFLLLIKATPLQAQIPPNAVNADPSAMSISQVPLGSTITGSAVLNFRFVNAASSANSTGQVPANSVRITISFPGKYGFSSVNSIPKFIVEDATAGPLGVVHLVNNALILEGEVIDLRLNVDAYETGAANVTFNVDRTTPPTVANLQTANDNTFSTFTVNGVLPVSIVSFTANSSDCLAKLSWQVSDETSLKKYEVELALNEAQRFSTTGIVLDAANSGSRSYNTNYQMQQSGKHFFRLKIIGADNSFTYSDVVIVEKGCSDANGLSIYPVPAINDLNIKLGMVPSKPISVRISDASGKIIRSVRLSTSLNKVDVSDLLPGMYFIRLEDGRTEKFLKQ